MRLTLLKAIGPGVLSPFRRGLFLPQITPLQTAASCCICDLRVAVSSALCKAFGLRRGAQFARIFHLAGFFPIVGGGRDLSLTGGKRTMEPSTGSIVCCGIEQPGSSAGSYPEGRGFKSRSRYQFSSRARCEREGSEPASIDPAGGLFLKESVVEETPPQPD